MGEENVRGVIKYFGATKQLSCWIDGLKVRLYYLAAAERVRIFDRTSAK